MLEPIVLDAHSNKSYHLGFGKKVTRSNLAKANETRTSKIFEEFAYHLIDVARKGQLKMILRSRVPYILLTYQPLTSA